MAIDLAGLSASFVSAKHQLTLNANAAAVIDAIKALRPVLTKFICKLLL
jgi:hypothetical protein